MRKTKINQGWTVETGDGGSLGALLKGESAEPKVVTLPHDHLVEIPRNPAEPNGAGNGFFHEEDIVYKTTLKFDPQDEGKRIWMEFEGVYQNAFIYVNDAFAGKCPYGYGNFYLDITRLAEFSKENTVKVIVKNGVPSGRWYTGGGIYRDVNLMVSGATHIAPDGVFVYAKDITEELAAIDVQVEARNEVMALKHVAIRATILDAEGNTAATGEITATLGEGEKNTYRVPLFVRSPKVWDTDEPYLYQYRAEILENGESLDVEAGSFGIRSLQLDPVNGLRVNGKMVKLRGGCIHHDNGIIGTREFPFAARERIRLLKEAGFNAVRSSHYPMSRQLLEACDEYGMFVMDEYSDVWTSTKVAYDYGMHMTEWWEHDIENLVRKDRNHPCVIMYSIGNEIPEAGNSIDVSFGKKLADRIRSLDPTRFTTNSINLLLAGTSQASKLNELSGDVQEPGEINSMMNSMGETFTKLKQSPVFAKMTEEAAGQVDIVGYNYALGRYELEGLEYPNRILVGSETNPGDLDKNWEAVEKLSYVIGDFDWTAWDYLGETGIGATGYGEGLSSLGMMYSPYPYKAAYCGDIDLIGERRAVSYWREIIWGLRTKPYIAVQPPMHYGEKKSQSQWVFTDAYRSWNFHGYEGKGIVVEIYADADEVELLVNGSSVGRKALDGTKRARTTFDTVYQPGRIEVVAYKGGAEIGRDEILTAADAVFLQAEVKSENGMLPADGSDIAYVDVSVVDGNGILNMDAARNVSVEIEGPGTLIGFGSASPCNEENYYDTTAAVYEGRLRAAIRATGSGRILVTFKTEDSETSVEIAAGAGNQA